MSADRIEAIACYCTVINDNVGRIAFGALGQHPIASGVGCQQFTRTHGITLGIFGDHAAITATLRGPNKITHKRVEGAQSHHANRAGGQQGHKLAAA